MRLKPNILAAIGNTPLVKLNKVVPKGAAEVWVKCEYLNPAGSIKDRMAAYIIEQAEKSGLAEAGRPHRREHLRQHRPRPRHGGGDQGLSLHLHDAGQDVEGEAGLAARLRRRSDHHADGRAR